MAYLESSRSCLDHLDGIEGVERGQRRSQGAPDLLTFDHTSPGVGDENIGDLSNDVALLCLSAAGREPHYFGSSCAVSFSRIVSATMGLPYRGGNSRHSGALVDIQAQEVERTLSVSFPSRNLATKLSQADFKWFAHELIPGMGGFQQPDLTFDDWQTSECKPFQLLRTSSCMKLAYGCKKHVQRKRLR